MKSRQPPQTKATGMNLGVLGVTNLAEQFMAVGLPVSTVAKAPKPGNWLKKLGPL